MATNIEMNLLKDNGSYEVLYPKVNWSNINGAPKLDNLTYVTLGSRIGTGTTSYTIDFVSLTVFRVIIYPNKDGIFIQSYPTYINTQLKHNAVSNTVSVVSGSNLRVLDLSFNPSNNVTNWGTRFFVTDGKDKGINQIEAIFNGASMNISITKSSDSVGAIPQTILNDSGITYNYYYFYN